MIEICAQGQSLIGELLPPEPGAKCKVKINTK